MRVHSIFSRLTNVLLSPSLLSLTLSFFLSLIILTVANWSYISPESSLNTYLFGPYGLTTVLQNSTNALSAINGIFSTPLAYNIAVGIFALFVGLFVYVALEGVDHVASKTNSVIQEVEFINDEAARKEAEHQVELRVGLRIATLFAWIAYLIFFARVVIPFCILVARMQSGDLFTWHNITFGLIGFIMLVIAFHVHTIFMRLLVLRPRLFGGENFIVGQGGH